MSFGVILADYITMEPKDYWPMLCSSLETTIFSSVITYSTCHKLSPVLTCECATHVGFTAGFPLWQSVDVHNLSTEAFRGSHSVGYGTCRCASHEKCATEDTGFIGFGKKQHSCTTLAVHVLGMHNTHEQEVLT